MGFIIVGCGYGGFCFGWVFLGWFGGVPGVPFGVGVGLAGCSGGRFPGSGLCFCAVFFAFRGVCLGAGGGSVSGLAGVGSSCPALFFAVVRQGGVACRGVRAFRPCSVAEAGLVGVVAVAGSRALPAGGVARVGSVAQVLAGSGRSLVVGCCAGADAAVLAAGVPVSKLRVLCAFGPGGVGSGPASAVAAVRAAKAAGVAVSWWAGGSAAVPLKARLVIRTRAVVAEASGGLVVFFGSPSSRGSFLACRCAMAQGLPVVAFPLGFSGSALPSLGAGVWWPVNGAGVWSGAWRWVSGQDRFV